MVTRRHDYTLNPRSPAHQRWRARVNKKDICAEATLTPMHFTTQPASSEPLPDSTIHQTLQSAETLSGKSLTSISEVASSIERSHIYSVALPCEPSNHTLSKLFDFSPFTTPTDLKLNPNPAVLPK